MCKVIKSLARNEKGLITLITITFIISSLGGIWKFGKMLNKGANTTKDNLEIAYAIEAYVKKQVEVNKEDIEIVMGKAKNIGKQNKLGIDYSHDILGIYNITIYQNLAGKIVELHNFYVISG